jgi:Cd2+/Zn2+-exporting ATPase
LIKPGERIAIDGLVVQGFSSVNQSSITGEFNSVEKSNGDEVYAGTLNEEGYLEVMASKKSENSTIAKIIYLVEEAQTKKAVSQQIMERFARYYTPVMITIAFAVILIPSLFFHQEFIPWFYRGLTLMVVSCPCALVISTPVSLISAIGNAARKGILIKGGCHLEEAGAASVVALDKTGTLTEGKPELLEVLSFNGGYSPEILAKAASLESMSEHPLGKAIVDEAQKKNLILQQPLDFEALTGRGVKGVLTEGAYYIGSPALFKRMNITLPHDKKKVVRELEEKGQTVLLLGTAHMIEGVLTLRDKIRPEAFTMVKQLKQMGIRTVMLTGDNDINARIIAEQLNLDEYHAGLLPQEKVDKIKELNDTYGKTMMVGDGINDAPALAASSIGLAMGAAGNDTALEAADIALMSDNLAVIPKLIHLSKATIGIIKQNIAFSLLIKLVAVLLIFPGWLSLWLAILADDGALIVVTMNGLRLMGDKMNLSGS